jgi:hypothetical protein
MVQRPFVRFPPTSSPSSLPPLSQLPPITFPSLLCSNHFYINRISVRVQIIYIYIFTNIICFTSSTRTAPSAANWASAGDGEPEVSLFDFAGISRRGGQEDASGAAAAEKLREEFNSLLAGAFKLALEFGRVMCDV